MAKQFSSNIAVTLLFILNLVLNFFLVNSVSESVKQAATLNLFLSVSLGSLLLYYSSIKKQNIFYPISGTKDFFNDISVGFLVGLLTLFSVSFFIGFLDSVYNLLGTISPVSVSSLLNEELYFVILAFPLTETFVLVGGTLVIATVLPKSFPYKKIFAGFLVMLLFAAFHFAAKSGGLFENSLNGYVNFVGSPMGALPQFLLGGLWILAAIAFESWIVAWIAHVTSNAVSIGLIVGFANPAVLVTLLVLGLIFVLALSQNRLKELNTFNYKRWFS